SAIHDYDNNFQVAWYHQLSTTTQNEARVQWNYYSFNVIPNEAAQTGLQIPGFINNLGTNIFLPNLTILRRYEFADNFSVIRGHHAFKFGAYELIRGNHTESHTFFPGRWVFGSLPEKRSARALLPPPPQPPPTAADCLHQAPASTRCKELRWASLRFTSRASAIRPTGITRGR